MSINKIINILEKEIEICQGLVDLSKKIRTAVEGNNIDEIDRLVRMEDALTMKFSAIEKSRASLVKEYMIEVGYDGDNYCITELEKYVDEKNAKTLTGIKEKLTNTISELAQLNQTNNMLIKSRLDWIDFSLQTLNSMEGKTYDINNDTKNKKDGLINELI